MSEVDVEGSRVRVVGQRSGAREGGGNWLERGINRSPARAFVLLTLLYGIAVATLSSFKLLWLDELITLHIARLDSMGAIWHALAQGVDPNPPITYSLVHYARAVFGDHEFAYRLPAFCGYWLGLLSLFVYLKRRLPATWALAGTVLSMTMAAFDYSYESRSYAIFYGLAMLAMLCWTVTVDGASSTLVRGLSLAGMILALAAGISTNYFAVLAFFPIAAGEFARTLVAVRRFVSRSSGGTGIPAGSVMRQIDLRIWIGLLGAGATLLAYRSMIAHSIAQFAPYAWNRVSLDQVFDSYTEMVEIVLYPILGLFAFAIIVWLLARHFAPLCRDCRDAISQSWIGSLIYSDPESRVLPLHEAVAIFTFMMYPILGYIIASIHGGMLSPRFVIPVCFGFAMAGTCVAYRLFGRLSRAATTMLCFCLAWFVARESVVGYWYNEQKQSFYKIVHFQPEVQAQVPPGAPIVIPDPLLALTFRHYAPPALAAREVFPLDFPALRAYRGDDSPEENLWAGRKILYTLPIVPLATFQHSAGKYLILATNGNWLVLDLEAHRYPVHLVLFNTRSGGIGGFTPLAHGKPSFFEAEGDETRPGSSSSNVMPVPFRVEDDLPGSKAEPPNEIAKE
jgi:hypothetical protein